tara:strand:+ start:32 stop:190 length:159 start_codon:yes stop_codon:yes gene_type:complete
MKNFFDFITSTGMKELFGTTVSLILMFVFFYFLSIFLCAIDDQCASFYMGGA